MLPNSHVFWGMLIAVEGRCAAKKRLKKPDFQTTLELARLLGRATFRLLAKKTRLFFNRRCPIVPPCPLLTHAHA